MVPLLAGVKLTPLLVSFWGVDFRGQVEESHSREGGDPSRGSRGSLASARIRGTPPPRGAVALGVQAYFHLAGCQTNCLPFGCLYAFEARRQAGECCFWDQLNQMSGAKVISLRKMAQSSSTLVIARTHHVDWAIWFHEILGLPRGDGPGRVALLGQVWTVACRDLAPKHHRGCAMFLQVIISDTLVQFPEFEAEALQSCRHAKQRQNGLVSPL